MIGAVGAPPHLVPGQVGYGLWLYTWRYTRYELNVCYMVNNFNTDGEKTDNDSNNGNNDVEDGGDDDDDDD